jgi:hypothetical protein
MRLLDTYMRVSGVDKECETEQADLAAMFRPANRGCSVRILAGASTILIEVFHRLSQSLMSSVGIVPGLGYEAFPSKIFTILAS